MAGTTASRVSAWWLLIFIIGNAARIGRDHLEPGLNSLAEKHSVIGEVRGRGVFWALELVQDRITRTPVTAEYMSRLKAELLRRGLLPFIADNRIHVVPPPLSPQMKSGRQLPSTIRR